MKFLGGWSANRKLSLRTRGDVGLHGPITSRTTPNRTRSVGQAERPRFRKGL